MLNRFPESGAESFPGRFVDAAVDASKFVTGQVVRVCGQMMLGA